MAGGAGVVCTIIQGLLSIISITSITCIILKLKKIIERSFETLLHDIKSL